MPDVYEEIPEVLLFGRKVGMKVHCLGLPRHMLVRPLVVQVDSQMGIIVTFYELNDPNRPTETLFWKAEAPHPVFLWRAMQIVQELPSFTEIGQVGDAYCAAMCMLNPGEDQDRVEGIIQMIGAGTYQKIMAQPINDQVVALMRDPDNEGN